MKRDVTTHEDALKVSDRAIRSPAAQRVREPASKPPKPATKEGATDAR